MTAATRSAASTSDPSGSGRACASVSSGSPDAPAEGAGISSTGDLFDALDLPTELQPLQDAYWKAKREWQELDAAYRRVLENMVDELHGFCTCLPRRREGKPWYAHQPGCPLREHVEVVASGPLPAPGMTDLMVTPESLDAYLVENPPPAPDDATNDGYPTAGELLEAVEALLHWRRISINENQGGAWFYDAEGMGTKPLDPTELRRMYEKEAEVRGVH